MSELLDARPPGIDLLFRPGTTVTVTLVWPNGSLAGRSFTSTLGGTTLSVNVVGDEMAVTASDTITDAATAPATWLLLEDVGGTDEPIIAGTWAPSDRPQAASQQTVVVTQGEASVDVTVAAAGLTGLPAADLTHVTFSGVNALLFPQGGLVSPYPIWTAHDSVYWWPAALKGNATFTDNGATLARPPIVEFPNTSTTRVKWAWSTGIPWESYTVKFGYLRPGSATGVATFKYYEMLWSIPGLGGTSLAVTPTLYSTVTTVDLSTMTTNYGSSNYVDIVTKSAGQGFMLSILEMQHDAGTTTLNGPVGVYVVTATRV